MHARAHVDALCSPGRHPARAPPERQRDLTAAPRVHASARSEQWRASSRRRAACGVHCPAPGPRRGSPAGPIKPYTAPGCAQPPTAPRLARATRIPVARCPTARSSARILAYRIPPHTTRCPPHTAYIPALPPTPTSIRERRRCTTPSLSTCLLYPHPALSCPTVPLLAYHIHIHYSLSAVADRASHRPASGRVRTARARGAATAIASDTTGPAPRGDGQRRMRRLGSA